MTVSGVHGGYTPELLAYAIEKGWVESPDDDEPIAGDKGPTE